MNEVVHFKLCVNITKLYELYELDIIIGVNKNLCNFFHQDIHTNCANYTILT